MEHRDKILIFEYIIFKLVEWEKTIQPNITHPEFSFGKLKALKLLFFVASVNATRTEHKLLDIFNRFYAMTYGPVESEVYNAIQYKETYYYDIKDRITILKSNSDIQIFDDLDNDIKSIINRSVDNLKNINPKIVDLPAYKLVDITHKWPVWKNAMSIANILGRRSEIMEGQDIIESEKFYE